LPLKACNRLLYKKGNVKENSFPSTGSREKFLDFQPMGASKTLGSEVCPRLAWLVLFFPSQLRSGFGGDNATRIVKLASLCGCNYVNHGSI